MKWVELESNIPEVAVRPTKNDPQIQVIIGEKNGEYVPKSILYPDHFTDSEIRSKVEHYNATKKTSGCRVCDRFKAEDKIAERNENIAILLGGVVLGIITCSIIGYYMTKKGELK